MVPETATPGSQGRQDKECDFSFRAESYINVRYSLKYAILLSRLSLCFVEFKRVGSRTDPKSSGACAGGVVLRRHGGDERGS